MKLFILPYRKGSKSVRQLKENLDLTEIKLVGSKFVHTMNKLVINWGNSNPPANVGCNLNPAGIVELASDKAQTFFELFRKEVPVPKFTMSIERARGWFADDPKAVVFCRKLLRSSQGKGIVIAKSPDELVAAPLYTLRVPKKTEYRVHVFNNVVIDAVEKRLKDGEKGKPDRNQYIRNYENGYIFAHENVDCPQVVKDVSIKAVAALGLDFGAVDVAVNKEGSPFVFEVNTAPGLECSKTVEAYVNAIKSYKLQKEQKPNENLLIPNGV